jgi:hypothetical protein
LSKNKMTFPRSETTHRIIGRDLLLEQNILYQKNRIPQPQNIPRPPLLEAP